MYKVKHHNKTYIVDTDSIISAVNKVRITDRKSANVYSRKELEQKLENQAKLRNITDSFPKISSRQEQELRKYAQRFSYEMEEVWDGLNSRVNREGMSIDKAVEDLKETMVAQKSLYDSAINDAEIPHITKEQWNKIPKDYKHVDPKTGKKMAFAGSLRIAPGGTTLLTEGMHFIIDSEEKNYTYIMHGTTGDFKVDNLTKERAEYLLKNNRGLGYDGEIIKETTNKIVKDFDPIELRNVAKNCNGSENKDSQGYIGFTFRNTNDAEKFEDWLVKNKYQYNTNGYKYYVEIEDKSVFSKETLNSIQNGIEQDFEEMKESREELHDESIKVNSVDELVSKIRNWNGENITYFYKPWDRIWYFTTVVTLGSKYNYYGFIDKTLTGRHENPNVDLKKQEVHEKVYSKDIEELKQKVINILK